MLIHLFMTPFVPLGVNIIKEKIEYSRFYWRKVQFDFKPLLLKRS